MIDWVELPVDEWLPRILPAMWIRQPDYGPAAVFKSLDGLAVLISAKRERDSKRWLHVSASRQNRIPSWEDLREIKLLFIGAEKLAVQVLPRQSEYVNVNPCVLHLWHCLDGDPVPDFRVGGQV
jgi:hypothetical protein